MTGSLDADRDEVVAFHEAGHAAIMAWLDLPIRWATIDPDPEAGNGGAVAGRPMPKYVRDWIDEGGLSVYVPVPPRVRDRIEREVMSLFAGELAQERQTGTTEGSAAYFDHPKHGQVVVDGDWLHIIDLVDLLAFGDADRTAYADLLRARTAALLEAPVAWHDVEAVAAALLERRRLTGRDVRDVIAGARRSLSA